MKVMLTKPRVILIKETARCTVTLPKKHLGIIYERISSKIDDSVITQGVIRVMLNPII
jgi:hypothetical protein